MHSVWMIIRENTAMYITDGIAGLVVWYLASGAQGPRINTRLGPL